MSNADINRMVAEARRKRASLLPELNRRRWAFDKSPDAHTMSRLRMCTLAVLQLEEFIVEPKPEGMINLGIAPTSNVVMEVE